MITYKGQSAESAVPASSLKRAGTLDFRFADEEDALDIERTVSAGFSKEFDKNDPLYNRKDVAVAVITKEEIEKDCASPNKRWIVLETPVPEELVVACARLDMGKVMIGDSKAIVDLMAFVEDTQSTSTKDQMLVQLERIAKSQNIKVLVIEVSQHRLDIQEWLEMCGYEELGGRASEDENYLKPTMVFEFHKDLSKPSKAVTRAPPSSSARASGGAQAVELEVKMGELGLSDNEFEILTHASSEPPPGPMAGLISELFTALHKEGPGAV